MRKPQTILQMQRGKLFLTNRFYITLNELDLASSSLPTVKHSNCLF